MSWLTARDQSAFRLISIPIWQTLAGVYRNPDVDGKKSALIVCPFAIKTVSSSFLAWEDDQGNFASISKLAERIWSVILSFYFACLSILNASRSAHRQSVSKYNHKLAQTTQQSAIKLQNRIKAYACQSRLQSSLLPMQKAAQCSSPNQELLGGSYILEGCANNFTTKICYGCLNAMSLVPTSPLTMKLTSKFRILMLYFR